MKMIQESETSIVGKWINSDSKLIVDDNCTRIKELIQDHLIKLAHDSSGWDTLYLDPSDNRFWELSYEEGHLHGGGPPALRCISADKVKVKYGDNVIK